MIVLASEKFELQDTEVLQSRDIIFNEYNSKNNFYCALDLNFFSGYYSISLGVTCIVDTVSDAVSGRKKFKYSKNSK